MQSTQEPSPTLEPSARSSGNNSASVSSPNAVQMDRNDDTGVVGGSNNSTRNSSLNTNQMENGSTRSSERNVVSNRKGNSSSIPRNRSNNQTQNRNQNESSRSQNTFNYPTRILTFGFPFSGQPDIVRSLQKDEFYSNNVMFNNLKELCNWFFGQRFTIRFEREIQLACNLIYYGITTCTGQSTLGEEYCDLLQVQLKEKTKPQVNSNSNKFSPKTLYIVKSTSSTRLLFVLYELIIPYLFDRGTSHWLSHYFSPNGISENMRYYISMLKEFVQFILRFNLASFYVSGKFLQVSKRLAGVRYVSYL